MHRAGESVIPIANSDDKWQITATFANYIKIQLQNAYAVATAKNTCCKILTQPCLWLCGNYHQHCYESLCRPLQTVQTSC